MKAKAISAKYGINIAEFEQFLSDKHLEYNKSIFSGIVVDDIKVDDYVAQFKEHKELIRKKAEEEEAKRIAEEQARKKANEEARRIAEEQARIKAEEEAKRKAEEEKNRAIRIKTAQEAFDEAEKEEQNRLGNLSESERGEIIMANSVKLCREKLKGTWVQSGASYANNDIFGLWLQSFKYTGIDGEQQSATSNLNKPYNYRVFVTGDESGRCFLYVSGNPNGFCSSIGEIAFTEDNNFFTLSCKDSSFLFSRE